MAEGDADPEQGETTPGTGDADQTQQGATADGESDADSTTTGETVEIPEDQLQEIYNKGARETRRELEETLDSLREEREELQSRLEELSSNGASEDAEGDLYTEEQVEELKESLRSDYEEQVEELRGTLEETNREHARNRLIEALRAKGVVKPEVFADTFLAQGRVEADLSEGRDAIKVFTPDGNRMLNGDGDHASLEYLAESWAEENPEFVRSSTREGAGYGGSEGGGQTPPSSKRLSELSDTEKREIVEEHGADALASMPL